MYIRNAIPCDARVISSIFFRAWLQTYPNKEVGITEEDVLILFKEKLTDEGMKKREEHIRNLPANQKYFVAEIEDRVVGLCLLIKREEYDQLQAIYVDPEYQGRGVGNALFTALLPYIDKDLIVHVATYNERAIQFYEKLGFIDTGKRFTEERHRMPQSGVIIPEMEMILKKN